MKKKNNKLYEALICFSFILVAGIVVENIYVELNPKQAAVIIDVEKVKTDLEQSGLKPVEAKHWREL